MQHPVSQPGTPSPAAFDEHKKPFRPMEAFVEASRCLYCFDAPCIQACPTGIDVPSFIRKIASGNVVGAARTILSANILGASCARVCPTQVLCEGACVLDDRDELPIQIGKLQRYATDHVTALGVNPLPPPATSTGRTVAIVGAGPAGLGCAAELARLGHAVTVYERRPQGGGLNTYGIALYKMKPEVSLAEVELVRSLGVEFRYGVEIGRDLSAEELRSKHDAVFFGLGLGDGAKLGIPGEELAGVRDALDFIEELHIKPLGSVPAPGRVVVVGCGNTAIDAATQAHRIGASSVHIVYRRSEYDMSAYSFEYEHAKSDGVAFHFNTLPVEVLGAGGKATGLKVSRTQVGADGKVSTVAGGDSVLPVDLVLKAVGQEKQAALLATLLPGLALTRKGTVAIDPLTGATNLPGVYAGGDCANGGREVVNAVGEGKKAALGIHSFLGGVVAGPPVQPSRLGSPAGPAGAGLLAPIRAYKGQRAA